MLCRKRNAHDKKIKNMKSQCSVWFWKIGSKRGPHQKGLGKSVVSNSGLITKNMKHIDLMLSKLWRVLMITKRLCYEDRSENWFWWYQLPVGFSDPGFQSKFLAWKKQRWSGLSYCCAVSRGNAALWADQMLRCEGMRSKQHCSNNAYLMQFIQIKGCYAENIYVYVHF